VTFERLAWRDASLAVTKIAESEGTAFAAQLFQVPHTFARQPAAWQAVREGIAELRVRVPSWLEIRLPMTDSPTSPSDRRQVAAKVSSAAHPHALKAGAGVSKNRDQLRACRGACTVDRIAEYSQTTFTVFHNASKLEEGKQVILGRHKTAQGAQIRPYVYSYRQLICVFDLLPGDYLSSCNTPEVNRTSFSDHPLAYSASDRGLSHSFKARIQIPNLSTRSKTE
jgi:hypothetical protein